MSNYNFNNVTGFSSRNTDKYSSPINYGMGQNVLGSYDNLLLQTSCKGDGGRNWQASPCALQPKSNLQILFQGTPLPLKNEEIYSEISQPSMFLFANNTSNLACNNQYTSDRGPICQTIDQQRLLMERGKNQTYNNYNF